MARIGSTAWRTPTSHPAAADFALKPMDHVWEDGGAYALLGPSGCGKTTLLNIISGLVAPSRGAGAVRRHATSPRLPTEQRNIAQVFQFPVVYDTMTVRREPRLPACATAASPAPRGGPRVEHVADLLDLRAMLDRRARSLTAPTPKQKISLGRGLVREDVAAILFDEPLTVIDPHLKWELRSQLKELHRQLRITMIYVTHDQTEALTFADTSWSCRRARWCRSGTPEELFERPAHTFVGYFIGSPGMNVLPAAVEGDARHVGGSAIAAAARLCASCRGRSVELGIRPEFASLARGGACRSTLRRVDDLGRRRIARRRAGRPAHRRDRCRRTCRVAGDAARSCSMPRGIHVYADGRLVAGAGSA